MDAECFPKNMTKNFSAMNCFALFILKWRAEIFSKFSSKRALKIPKTTTNFQ